MSYSQSRKRRIRSGKLLCTLLDGAFKQHDDDIPADEAYRALAKAETLSCYGEFETVLDALTKNHATTTSPNNPINLSSVLATLNRGNRQRPVLSSARTRVSRSTRKVFTEQRKAIEATFDDVRPEHDDGGGFSVTVT